MNILVTGGAGFIGSHLCDRLVGLRHHVTVVDNLSLGKISNISHLIGNKKFMFFKADLLDKKRMSKIFVSAKFDTVFHLAANSDISAGGEDPSIDMDNTFLTTYAVLKLMRKYKVHNLIFASSSAIYGETKGPISEDHGPLLPLSHYGAGKLASEAFISSFADSYGFKAWILRFPNVMGERATHGIVYDFLKKLDADPKSLTVLGDGRQNKPYLYVGDLVDALLFVWKRAHGKVNCFNIAASGRTRVSAIAKLVASAFGTKPRIIYTGGRVGWQGDVPEFSYNTAKLKRLGWKPRYTSDSAVKHAIRKIMENR